MQVILDPHAGFCPGVRRAVQMAFEAAERETSPVWCLGKLIHNEDCMRRLRERGVRVADRPEEIPDGACVLIRAHGAPPEIFCILQEKNCKIVDATCGFVENIHRISKNRSAEGFIIIVIGEKEHPEVVGILGCCRQGFVVNDEASLLAVFDRVPADAPVCVVSQTTSDRKKAEKFAKILKTHYTNCEISDTICNATVLRQESAARISAVCDGMIVIGGRDSANTRRLAEVCRERCPHTVLIENASELAPEEFVGAEKVGITAGASTPEWIIKEVHSKL